MDENLTKILSKIQNISPSRPFWEIHPGDVFIYGTGTMGEDVHNILIDQGIPVRGFLDHTIRAPSLRGLPVMQPDTRNILIGERNSLNIVLAIHNPYANIPEIYSRLQQLGYRHIINPIELSDMLPNEMGVRYWLTRREFYKHQGWIIEKAYALWEDDLSKSIFTSILEHRISGDYSKLPEIDWEHRYAPVNIPQWTKPARIIDCGAYDGDSILDIHKSGVTFDAIAAFEPDPSTFQKLKSYFETNLNICKDVTLWPCGVFSTTSQMKFNAMQGVSSGISDTGDFTVQCVAIDDALPTFAPTLIKMDIEAAEYEAILGAQRTIQQYKPGLAISLYHRPEHLWQIPLLVERIANVPSTIRKGSSTNYKYYIRPHMANGYELVLYAIPVK